MSEAATQAASRVKFCGHRGHSQFHNFYGGQLYLRCATCRRTPCLFSHGVLIWLPEAGRLADCEVALGRAGLFHEELKLYI